METSIYLAKASLLVALFYGMYRAFLAQETFYGFNRLFLLSGLGLALLLPAIVLTRTIYVEPVPLPQSHDLLAMATMDPQLSENTPLVDWQFILPTIYLVVSLFLLLFYTFRFFKLKNFLNIQKTTVKKGIKYMEIIGLEAPFSFLNYIVYDPQVTVGEELNMILQHEENHVRGHHTIDILVGRFFCALFWLNPFMWLYAKAIEQNLEYLADSQVTKTGIVPKKYQLALLKFTCGHTPALAQSFYKSFIKKRIVMLNKTQFKSINKFKVLLLLPFMAVFLYSFNSKEVRVYKTEDVITHANRPFIIASNTTAEQIQIMEDYFKNEVAEVNIKIVVKGRNTENEITAFDFLTQFKGDPSFIKRFSKTEKSKVDAYRVQNLGDGKLQVQESGNDLISILIAKDKLEMFTEENRSPSLNGAIINAVDTIHRNTSIHTGQQITNPLAGTVLNSSVWDQDISFRYEVTAKMTTKQLDALSEKLKTTDLVDFSYSNLDYNTDGRIVAISLKMKDRKKFNTVSYNQNDEDGISSIFPFRTKEGTMGFTTPESKIKISSKSSNNSTSTYSTSTSRTETVSDEDEAAIKGSMQDHLKAIEAQTENFKKRESEMVQLQEELKIREKELQIKAKEMEAKSIEMAAKAKEMTQRQVEMQKQMEVNEVEIEEREIDASNEKNTNGSFIHIRGKTMKHAMDMDKILILIDGKESNDEAMYDLNPENLESIHVIKDENALKNYGKRAEGKTGVIEITTKKAVERQN